jgi:hypothetical protein
MICKDGLCVRSLPQSSSDGTLIRVIRLYTPIGIRKRGNRMRAAEAGVVEVHFRHIVARHTFMKTACYVANANGKEMGCSPYPCQGRAY